MTAVLILAVALAMDAFAVALGRGAARAAEHIGRRVQDALLAAGAFGLAQGVMAWLGWRLGVGVGGWIAAVDHWIAFGLLAVIGGRMLWGALRPGDDEAEEIGAGVIGLIGAAMATSIDAAAAGVAIPAFSVSGLIVCGVIALTAFVLSGIGGLMGAAAGARFGARAEALGGLLLIGIGTNILVQHLGSST